MATTEQECSVPEGDTERARKDFRLFIRITLSTIVAIIAGLALLTIVVVRN